MLERDNFKKQDTVDGLQSPLGSEQTEQLGSFNTKVGTIKGADNGSQMKLEFEEVQEMRVDTDISLIDADNIRNSIVSKRSKDDEELL